MPVYDYKCCSCGHCFECKQTFESEPFAGCPQCGAVAHRQLNSVPVIFKGSGFYITDSRASNSGSEAPTKKSPEKAESETAKPDKDTASGKSAGKAEGVKPEKD